MFEVYKILNSDKKTEGNGRKIFFYLSCYPHNMELWARRYTFFNLN